MIPRLLALGIAIAAQPALAVCADDKVTVSGEWGQAHFSVSVADDPQERARGLMYVEHMPMLSGMLFVYEEPHNATFWMKNTLIPLDMIFASPEGEILSIHENAIPGDLTTIDGGEGVQAVLEINGGLSRRLGIKIGDVLQHPSFGEGAIAFCFKKVDG